MNDTFVIRRELVNKNSSTGGAIVRALKTSIYTTLSPSVGSVGKKVPYSRKNVKSRVKRNIKRKLFSRSKRLMVGDLMVRNSMNSIIFTNLRWKDVVTLWV